ncbi:MAG: hypothetical protein J5I65_15330 [Aridibacter famidurans]|nr:hypothetical protein [Aridibacter famidurans]
MNPSNKRNLISIAGLLFLSACFVTGTFAQALEKAPPLPEGMTGSSKEDPRAKLPAGLYDAGQASMGMKHVALLKKPSAFDLGTVDADDPKVKQILGQLGAGDGSQIPPAIRLVFAQLAFANSDLAFQGDRVFMGNFYGMSIYDISDPEQAKLVTTMLCPGGQGDVSVYKNLMFMSVEMPNGRLDCGTEGFPPDLGQGGMPVANKDRFRGVRIFDISDIRNPKQVGAVQTCRGSHTHTLVTDPNDKENVYIYVSGTSFVRQAEELEGCSGGPPEQDPNTALFSIDVIKVPVKAPQNAAVVSSPRIFKDEETGKIAGLDSGGTHSDDPAKGTIAASLTDQCHDITVYSEIGLALGACSGNGLLLDISDPANPKRIDAVNDPNYAYWHSASFSNDGSKVVFTDEWGGGMGARCRANDPNTWGANALFRLNGKKLEFVDYYKMPAAQGDSENCVAHNGSLVPVPGRDIKVQAWYQGGISVMDFTDPSNPMEIAYFDRGPIDEKMVIMGGHWSAYWYNGRIYGSEIARGLDILELTPTRYLTQNEIAAAKTVQVDEFNVQNQEKIVWPNKLVVAKAYIDQLERSKALDAGKVKALRDAVSSAENSKLASADRTKLKSLASSLTGGSGVDAERMKALAAVLNDPVM